MFSVAHNETLGHILTKCERAESMGTQIAPLGDLGPRVHGQGCHYFGSLCPGSGEGLAGDPTDEQIRRSFPGTQGGS